MSFYASISIMHQLFLSFIYPGNFFLSGMVLAQASSAAASSELSTSPLVMLLQVVLSIGGYIFTSWCLQKIFEKLSMSDSWMAWVPIVSTVKTFQAGGQNPWLLLLVFIPIVGIIAFIVFYVMAFMNIAKKLGKASWLGILTIIPLVSLWAIYSLAN
jgi:Family of unknown function (DUF5684)